MMAYIRRGMGQISSMLSPSNCAAAGGVYDSDNETCLNSAPVIAGLPVTAGSSCAAGPGSACSWYDDIWATQGCLDWYAQCDPTNAFYQMNSKGAIVGGAAVLGATAGNAIAAAGNNLLGIGSNGFPSWVWVAALGLGAVLLLPPLMKAIK